MDRFGDESLPFWQRAFDLLTRGPLLCDEPYADWVTERRELHDGYYRQCVHALSHLYMARYDEAGKSEALLLLRTYWQQHKTDEDALRPLLELLGEQERYQEAEKYYSQFLQALTELNPTEDGKPRKPDARTSDIHDYLGTKQIQRTSMMMWSGNTIKVSHPASVLSSHLPLTSNADLAPVITPDIMKTIRELLVERDDSDMAFDPTRRKLLEGILTGVGVTLAAPMILVDPEPWERLSAARLKPSVLDGTTFQHFEHLLGEAWELSNINELEIAEGILSALLPKIVPIPAHQVDAQMAYLASQGLRLQSVLIHHRLHIADKVRICEQSVEYAHYANDVNTLVAALIELADAYEFDGQMGKCLQTLQEALHSSSQASPLLQSRTYSNTAIILAATGRKREAELYIELAHEVFPDTPIHDPGYALADSSVFTLSYHTGLVRLDVDQVCLASESFEFYKEHPSGINIPERLRLEIVNGLSKAAIRAKDLERYVNFFEDAIIGATTLGSKKRFDEAIQIFQREVPTVWHTDRRIKGLVEKYYLEG